MKISTSILSIKDNMKEKVDLLNTLDTDYIHLDIMDGKFVKNKTADFGTIYSFLSDNSKPLDVHLMVKDVKKYVDKYSLLNPEIITFHVEAGVDILDTINYIKSKNIKVGISVKPDTDISLISDYLVLVDLILVMSVEPGLGGQKFIPSVEEKIDKLRLLKNSYGYNYLIEVDGGINDKTLLNTLNSDIIVVGSFITSNDFKKQINILREKIRLYE